MAPPTGSLEELRLLLGDRYQLERKLGQGGMGAVYLARERRLDRPVAIKVLPPELAAQPELRERFLRETRTAASFSHPNIVPVHGVEEQAGLLAFAMGYVEGESLAARVARAGPLSVKEAVRLLQDVGWALAYAHGRGVVHRDIKPDNILLERATGRALVTDFGIARAIAQVPTDRGLTRVGEVVGTPEFMSPEQASGDQVDGRSDLYSLGLVAFFAVTGRLAVSGDSTQQIVVRQLTEAAPPVASLRPDLPAPLAQAIDRLLKKEPAERFPSAEALVEALETAQLAEPEVALPIRLLAQDLGQLGMVAVFIAVVAMLLQQKAAPGRADVNVALPALFLVAILWGRFAMTLGAARRVVEAGFSPAEILAGFGRLLGEREAERARLRTLSKVVARRRRTVQVFSVMIVVGALMILFVLTASREVTPGQFQTPRPYMVMLFSAVIMIGIAFIGLVRNPFRTSVGERFFRLVWMGWVGRLLLRFVSRGLEFPSAGSASSGRMAAVPAPSPAAAAPVGAAVHVDGQRLKELETRLEALERWRAEGGGRAS
jgi:hypothetical protein